jgi:hypothetical protein
VDVLHAGLDLSRRRLDYCLLGGEGERVQRGAVAPDADALVGLVRLVELRHGRGPVCAAIESMNGARFVHDALERCGWEVQIAGPRSCAATPACAHASTSPASPTAAARWPSTAPSTCAGALMEAATNASKHRLYRDRYQQTKQRVGRQRGAKVAQIELARTLTEAIWHMLTRNQTFAPAGAPLPLAA